MYIMPFALIIQIDDFLISLKNFKHQGYMWGLVVIIMLWSKTVNGGFNNSVVCVDGEFQRSLKFSLIIMVLHWENTTRKRKEQARNAHVNALSSN